MSVTVEKYLSSAKGRGIIGIMMMTVSGEYRKAVKRQITVVSHNREVKHHLINLGITVATNGKKGDILITDIGLQVGKTVSEEENNFAFSYDTSLSIPEKIETIVRRVYGGDGISILPAAKKQIDTLVANGFGDLPICMAKTQYSFSDDPTKLGAPENFTVTIKNVRVSAGAGFVVVLTGDIMTMPGLPRVPAAEAIDVTEDGKIVGLF